MIPAPLLLSLQAASTNIMPRTHQLLLLLFLALYLLFPSNNSSPDSVYYAAAVKYSTNLFMPHHLLYNATGVVVIKALEFAGLQPDALALLKVLNAFATVVGLWLLSRILLLLQMPVGQVTGWLLIAGASFGVWRFATESEVYIFPILLSLCGSYFWIRWISAGLSRFLALAGLCAAVACLYHQMHFFWWFGLLLGTLWHSRNLSAILQYALPALLVPLAYLLVLWLGLHQELTVQNLLHFVLHDFYMGSAKSDIGLANFAFSAVNLARTFAQAHLLMLSMVSATWLWLLPAAATLMLLIWALLEKQIIKPAKPGTYRLLIGNVHALVLALHLLFAWFAVGNAEFMAMIPFLLPLLPWVSVSGRFLQKTGAALLVWNFWYGAFPAWNYKLSATADLAEIVHIKPQSLFVLHDAQKVMIEYFYKYGEEEVATILYSPSIRANRNKPLSGLHHKIASHLSTGQSVYTDCIGKVKLISRSSLTVKDVDAVFFDAYLTTPADSVSTFYGFHYLHQVGQKK